MAVSLITNTRAQRLSDFLRAGASATFRWGVLDCALWACDWIYQECGVDPALSLRGTYATRGQCTRVLARGGGLPALAAALAAEKGLAPTNDPALGDVGAVQVPELGCFLAVRAGAQWAIKSAEGVVLVGAQHVAAWSVPDVSALKGEVLPHG